MEQLSATLIHPNEVARRLGVDRTTVYRWIKSGELPSVKVGIKRPGKHVREEDLRDFVRQRTEGVTS